MFGILNIDKSAGVTSRDVVSRIQHRVRPTKVGHAGTLDPLATGVLLVGVGPATRLVPYLQQLSKQYTATFLLGQRSSSDDTEEPVEIVRDAPIPRLQQIHAAIPKFVGEILQRPPLYSALKIRGKRAYTLAREGSDLELPPRPVKISSITVVSFDYPALILKIECGSGTYVRSLGRDLAAELDTFAVMSALRRNAIGDFQDIDAWDLAAADRLDRATICTHLQSAALAVDLLPKTVVSQVELDLLGNGREISRVNHGWDSDIAAMDEAGQLAAILTPCGPNSVRPMRNFLKV